MKIAELQPGDELICYMRLGLALKRTIRPRDNMEYREVPRKARRARSGDLTRFTGVVVQNNADEGVLTMMTTRMDSMKTGYNSYLREPALRADIHYTAFRRVQRLSKFATPGRTDRYPSRPTSTEGLGTQSKAFRTLEEVEL